MSIINYQLSCRLSDAINCWTVESLNCLLSSDLKPSYQVSIKCPFQLVCLYIHFFSLYIRPFNLYIQLVSLNIHFVGLHIYFVELYKHFVRFHIYFVESYIHFVGLYMHFVKLYMHFVGLYLYIFAFLRVLLVYSCTFFVVGYWKWIQQKTFYFNLNN